MLYVSSDPKDNRKEYKNSLMYRYVDFHINWILLNITLPPPQPEATHTTTTDVPEGGMMMKIISLNNENKGKGRSNKTFIFQFVCLELGKARGL